MVLWAHGEQSPQPSPFQPVHRDRPAQPPRLSFHPDVPGIVIKRHRDGSDFIRICEKHRWASPPLVSISCCPFCLSDADETDGRYRFEQLQAALALGL